MKTNKWWSFQELWAAVFALLMGATALCLMVWKGVQVGEAGWIVAGIIGGAAIISLGVLQFIGYVQELRSPDDDDEPVAQRPQQEARV